MSDELYQIGLARIATACRAAFDRELTIGEVVEVVERVAVAFGWPCIDSDQGDDNFSMLFKRGGL